MNRPGREAAPPRRTRRDRIRPHEERPLARVLRLASVVGNRVFAARLAQEAGRARKAAVWSPEPHPALPRGTPAWAEDGRITLGPEWLLLSRQERSDILHHETIHALQQQCAPVDESSDARQHAEALAQRPQGDLPVAEELRIAAPRLLAAPVTGKPLSGFSRLFAGDGEVIGEVIVDGVTVRARNSYEKLGIEAPVDPNNQFGTATMSDLQSLVCGNRAFPALARLAEGLRNVAQRVAAVNESIPKASGWRVQQVFVTNEASRLHVADGQPLITLSQDEFNHSAAESAAHEASHALFESHTHARPDTGLAPDAFSLRVADLFGRLSGTTTVPIPTEAFRKKRPPLRGNGHDAEEPAGLVMVMDSLWSGGPSADAQGHPWDGPDELFASANAAFLTDEKLLRQIIAHYAGADASVKVLGAELLELLKVAKDADAARALNAPGAKQSEPAREAIRKRESSPSTIKERLGYLLNPEALPPRAVICPR